MGGGGVSNYNTVLRILYGSFRKLGGTLFGVLIIWILLFKGTILGSPIIGNSRMSITSGKPKDSYFCSSI